MSAFLVSAQTISEIVAGIRWLLNLPHRPQLAKTLAELGIDTTQEHWEEQLAQAMFALNASAVAQRYHKSAATSFTYQWVPLPANPYQLLKSIDCWLYQCSEGDVPKSKLYQWFQGAVVTMVLRSIVERSPKYEKAAWE